VSENEKRRMFMDRIDDYTIIEKGINQAVQESSGEPYMH
jgi:hypothetical protein